VNRVLGKALPGAPHEVLLILDATVGQNAIAQAKQFQEAVGVTGIALAKLDGTAKGGVVIGISDELKIPVTWVGVGEKIADLRPFDPHEFVEALFEPSAASGVGTTPPGGAARAPAPGPWCRAPCSAASPGRAGRSLCWEPVLRLPPRRRRLLPVGASLRAARTSSPVAGRSPPTRAGATARATTAGRWCSTSSAAGRMAE